MSTEILPHSLALASKPEGIASLPIVSREQWLAMREQDVTASAIAALLGVDPYQTPYALHAIKAGLVAPEQVASEPEISADGLEITLPPAARGHQREPEAIGMVKLLRPQWRISHPLGSYWRDPIRRIGATPDAMAIDPGRSGFGVIQVKTVSAEVYRDKWIDPDTSEPIPPMHVVIQALTESMLTGASWAEVAVHRENYGSRPSVRLIEIPIHKNLWQRLQDEVALFWERIEKGTPPDPDYGRDGRIIAGLYAETNGSVVEIAGDRAERLIAVIAQREALNAREKDGNEAAKDRKPLDAEIIHILGNADAGRLPDGRVITARTTRRGAYQVAPTSFRTVTVKGISK